VIPGIGGSVLLDGDRPVWGRSVSDLMMSSIDSDCLNLAERPHFEAVGLIDSMLIPGQPGVTVFPGGLS
jgi:hypothetical protein